MELWKIENVTLRMPRLVICASTTFDENVKMSYTVFQETPNARAHFSMSMSTETVGETSDEGRASRTVLLLPMNLVNLKLPSFIISISCFASLIAVASESTDFSQSST